MTRTVHMPIPAAVAKRLPNLPHEVKVPRPVYATVGAGDLAVQRVKGAALAVQERITGAQKTIATKATELRDDVVTDNITSASTAYAEFARRGEQLVERIWPSEPATKLASVPAAKQPAPKKPASKAPVKKAAPKAGPRAAAQPATKVAAPRPTTTK